MFRLNATLVTTMRLQPWRTGWPLDRGVEVSLAEVTQPAPALPMVRGNTPAAEPVSFIDEDQAAPSRARSPGAATERRPSGSGADPVSDTAGLRAWWSLSGKPLRM